MKKWIIYLQERSPLAALTFLSGGVAISSMAFLEAFSFFYFILGIFFINLVMIQMRLGDELKDFGKDKIINPTRPLPRGLLTTSEVLTALKLIVIFTVLSGFFLAYQYSMEGGLTLSVSALFAWLMYKEFYIGANLAKSPIFYALTHQVVVFPLFSWIGLTMSSELLNNQAYLGWILANFGASFTYEVCRKLNPDAHKLAETYAHHYGRTKTVLICLIFMSVSVIGAYFANIAQYSLPMIFILALSLLNWTKKPKTYKLVEGMSVLSSTVILLTPAILWLIKRWN